MKRVYQSLRATQSKQMMINVDVSNSIFWNERSMINKAKELIKSFFIQNMTQKCKSIKASKRYLLSELERNDSVAKT